MEILAVGVLLWSLVHFVPSIAQPVKKLCIKLLGENGYKLVFSVFVIMSLGLMVYGWRHITPIVVYNLPLWVKPISLILMVVAFVLFGAANYQTRIKSFIRHPQLIGVISWSTAHLLVNGDNRSIVLFGGMGIWAMLEIFVINRRDGAWIKQTAAGWPQEFKGLAISLIVFIIAVLVHPYIAGVSLR